MELKKKVIFLKREKQLRRSQREKRIETDLRSEMGAKHLDFSVLSPLSCLTFLISPLISPCLSFLTYKIK